MDFQRLSDWLSPDLARVLRRFPLAVVFAVAATAVVLTVANDLVPFDEEEALRLVGGAVVGFILALAGQLFIESRPEARKLGLVLAYPLPLLAPVLFQVRDTGWIALPMLPVAALLWLSVAGFTHIGRGAERGEIENRFWWLNQRAVVSGVIAVAATAVFFVGLLAIDQSLSLLFGIEIWDVMVNWVLPVVCCLLAPIYWLAVLPRLEDYDARALGEPDFLTQAIGFVGLFVLTPLLAIYTLILFAYAVQIAVTQTLPVGVLGWLVLAFVVTGAANLLVLYPQFVRTRLLARLFRKAWFWATLLPLLLFAIGLYVRVDAYGLTPERLLLVAGGVWAVLLAVVYLMPGGRGDIRLIPALAGLVFLVLGFGPFNILVLPAIDQAGRFEAALAEAQAEGGSGWTPELAQRAQGALGYFAWDDANERLLRAALARQGFDVAAVAGDTGAIARLIGLPPQADAEMQTSLSRTRPEFAPVPIAGTPFFLGDVVAHTGNYPREQAGLSMSVSGLALTVAPADNAENGISVDLSDWLERQAEETTISDPVIDFTLDTRRFRLVARTVQTERPAPGADEELVYLGGWLLSDRTE